VVESVVGTVDTAVVDVLVVAHTAEPAVGIAAGAGVAHIAEGTAAVAHYSLVAAARAIDVRCQAPGVGSEA
jgi:hypothetical protein